jgi:hypothetical protein
MKGDVVELCAAQLRDPPESDRVVSTALLPDAPGVTGSIGLAPSLPVFVPIVRT